MAVEEIVVEVATAETLVVVDEYEDVVVTQEVSSPNVIEVLAGGQGVPGPAPVLTFSAPITGAAGSNADVSTTGDNLSGYNLVFTIPRGNTGATGPANTLSIGTVTTLAPSATATASITGTAPNQTLNLGIPEGSNILSGAGAPAAGTGLQGDWYINTTTWDMSEKTSSTVWTTRLNIRGAVGPANTLTVGTVTTGAAGSSAAVTITGTAPNQTINLTIPRGDVGATGAVPTIQPTVGVTTGAAGTSASASWTGSNPYTLNLTIPRGDPGTGNVTQSGALTVGNLASWNSTGGLIQDAGFAASDVMRLTTNQTVTSGTKTFNGSVEANAGGQGLSIKPGAADHAYMAFFARTATPGTRTGYFGFSSAAATTLTLANEISAGGITLSTTGNGGINLNAGTGNITATGTLIGTVQVLDGAQRVYSPNNIPSASIFTTGTLADARLSSNVMLLTGAQTVTGVKTLADQLNITGSKSINWSAAGVAAPTFTTQSGGTKIVLYPFISASTVDYAIGIENSTMWHSVPASGHQFKWYAGTTSIATLSGAGSLSLSGSVTATSFVGAGSALTGITISQVSGVVPIAQIPTGTSGTTVAFGNHGHALTDANITGILPIAQIPTGTTGTTVALGNHLHTGVYEPVIAAGTGTQYWTGSKTWATLDKTAVGLGSVTNAAQVDLTTNQSIGGTKTFTTGVTLTYATTANRVAVLDSSKNLVSGGATTVEIGFLSGATSNIQTQISARNTQRFIFTTGSEARPTGTTYVEWVGPVTPTNSVDGDTWVNTA